MSAVASPQVLHSLGDDVIRGASRSLELLRAIETTIAQLCYEQRYHKTMATWVKEIAEIIRKSPRKIALDLDGKIEEKLLESQKATRNLHDVLIAKRESAISDPRLTDDDGVADEYARTIQIVAELHNAINVLRWAAAEHDSDVRAKTGSALKTYAAQDIEKLIADLKA